MIKLASLCAGFLLLAFMATPAVAFNISLLYVVPGNTHHITQSGVDHYSRLVQSSPGNDATVAQQGSDQKSDIEQVAGSGNTASVPQTGSNSSVSIYQNGSNNSASVSVSGTGTSWVAVGQVGDGNTFTSTASSW